MHDEELRTRLQTLAEAGRVAPTASTLAAVRARRRRKVRNGLLLPLVALLALGGGAVRLLPESSRDVAATAPSTGPLVIPPTSDRPVRGPEPAAFVAQIEHGPGDHRIAVVASSSGRILRWVPGQAASGVLVIRPDLGAMYLPDDQLRATNPCGTSWTRVDLESGARRPAFGGQGGVTFPALSADGRYLAFFHGSPTGGSRSCRQELVVRDLATGRQRSWTVPDQGTYTLADLQWSPDSTRLAYLMWWDSPSKGGLYVLALEGTSSVTQGRLLPPPGGDNCNLTFPRFRPGTGRLLALQQACGNQLVDFDVRTGKALATTPIPLSAQLADVAVDRSGQHVILAVADPDKQPGWVYVVRGGRIERVPSIRDCYLLAW
jgi:hypothetical protein